MTARLCIALLWLTPALAATSAAASQNTFPPELRGTFVSNKYGLLTFGEDFVDGISLIYQHCSTCGEDMRSYKFNLVERNDTRHLLRSDAFLHGEQNKSNIWMCWYLTAVTPVKWKFFQAPLRKHEQFFDYVSMVKETTCDQSGVVPTSKFNILLLSTNTESTLSVSCPQSIQGRYEFPPDVTSCVMEMDIVNETIDISNPQCHTFSSFDQNMSCVHYEGDEEGRWYVLALGLRNVSHWNFFCMVFRKNGDAIIMTHQGNTCEDVIVPNFTTYHHLLKKISDAQIADEKPKNITVRIREHKNSVHSRPILVALILLLSSLPFVILCIWCLRKKKNQDHFAAPKHVPAKYESPPEDEEGSGMNDKTQ